MLQNPSTCLEALDNYKNSRVKKWKYDQAKTAITKYVLPTWPWYTPEESSNNQLAKLTLQDLAKAPSLQEETFKALGTPAATAASYRYALREFLAWLEEQEWWPKPFKEQQRKRANKMRNKAGIPAFKDKPKLIQNKLSPYALKDSELTDELKQEFQDLIEFWTQPMSSTRQTKAVRRVTVKEAMVQLKQMLGWLHRSEAKPLEKISLQDLVPSHDKNGATVVSKFVSWYMSIKGKYSAKTIDFFFRAAVLVAKYIYRQELSLMSYLDSPLIKELNKLKKQVAASNYGVSSSLINTEIKEATWSELLYCTEQLRLECAAQTCKGKQRANYPVARSYKRFIIFSLLTILPPDRGRTYRELELGRTFRRGFLNPNGSFKPSEEGDWYIWLEPKDYKTGDLYGTQITKVPNPQYSDNTCFYDYLDVWLKDYRSVFKAQNDLLLPNEVGQVHCHQSFKKIILMCTWRLIGKHINPHLFRHIYIAEIYRSGASAQELDATALAMKHSPQMQRKVYDIRTQQEKAAPAYDLISRINQNALSKT